MNFPISFNRILPMPVFFFLTLHSSVVGQLKPSPPLNTGAAIPFPSPETLTYRVEWRMVTAGAAKLQLKRQEQDWQLQLNIESAGLVSRLFRIQDDYKAAVTDQFCAVDSSFEAHEGKRHVLETQQFDDSKHKAIFDLHDLVKNLKQHQELEIAPCTREIVGALESLRGLKIDLGKSITMPIANGKKMANVRIQSVASDNLHIQGTSYTTTRYEAFVFDNVLFHRHGLLLIWLTDDPAHTPVQMQFQMGFPIGNITVELENANRT